MCQPRLIQFLCMYGDDSVEVNGVTYNLTGLIGQGSCGSVYVVEDAKNTAAKFALKYIWFKGMYNVKQMVLQEVDIQMKFAGEPTIIQVVGFKQEQHRIFIIFELGTCSLRGRMDERPYIELKDFIDIMLDVTRGLMVIHSKKLIHRDIKPQNIICVEKTYKITDFGNLQTGTIGGQMMGTPLYLPPQILFNDSGEMEYDQRVDVWSLGVSLFEVYFHIHPFYYHSFQNKDSGQVIKQMKHNIAKLTPNFTMDRFLSHLLTQKQKQAYDSVSNKLLVTPPAMIEVFGQFFESHTKRSDIGFFVALTQSLESDIKDMRPIKMQKAPEHKGQLPSDVKFYIETIDLLNELALKYGTPELEEVVFHLQLGLWYWNFYNYQGSHLVRYKNYRRLKLYRKDKLILWQEVQDKCLEYFCNISSSHELLFFHPLPILKVRILICGARFKIYQSLKKFIGVVGERVGIPMQTLEQLENLLAVLQVKQLKTIQEIVTTMFYYS